MTHRIPRTIRYRGKVYRGWQALADGYGLSVSCAQNRIDRGLGQYMARMVEGMTLKNQKPVEYKGVIYPSTTALAEAYGLRRDTLNLRLKKHIPLEMSRYAKGVITYHGIDYPSMTALAEHFDLKLSTCHMRLKRGVPLTRPVHKGALKPLEYEGVRYESVREFSERNGIRYEVASACIDGVKGRWLDEREKD